MRDLAARYAGGPGRAVSKHFSHDALDAVSGSTMILIFHASVADTTD